MRLIDTSPMFAQTPESGFSRGMSHLTNVLDAMIERKRREEEARAAREQQAALAAVDDQRAQQAIDQQWYQGIRQDERLRAQDEAQAAHQAAQLKQQRQQQRAPFQKELEGLAGQGRQAFDAGAGALASSRGYALRPKEIDPMGLIGTDEEVAARRKAVEGRYTIDYGEGETADFDPAPFGPEAQAAAFEQQFAGLPKNNPAVQRAIAEGKAALAARAIDPRRAYEATVGQANRDAAALKRARVSAATRAATAPTGAVYGRGGVQLATTPNPKHADEVNKANAAYAELDGLLSKMEQSYQQHGKVYNDGKFIDKSEIDARDAARGQATIAYKEMANLGALAGPDLQLVEEAIAGGWTGEQAAAKLREARSLLARKQGIFLDARGLPGAQIVPRLTGQARGAADNGAKALEAEADALIESMGGGKRR